MKRILTACLLALASCAGAEDADAVREDAGKPTTVNEVPSEPVPTEPVAPAPMCREGEVWCGASCENLQTSLGSCGACNLHCPETMRCVKGACTEK